MYLSNKKTIIKLIAAVMMLSGMNAFAQENPVVAADTYYEAANITETQERLLSIFNSAMGGSASSSGAAGEQGSYSVNQVTGSFCYDYPIEIPRLTQGPSLDLRLHYDSQHANDFLGMGFSLIGLPKIQRDSRYDINFNKNDHFTLDGQKLIPDVKKQFYRSEVDDHSYTYGALFDDEKEINTWKTYLKDGTVLNYASQIKHENGLTYAWGLSSIEDVRGNRVEIDYENNLFPIEIRFIDAESDECNEKILFTYGKDREDFYGVRLNNNAMKTLTKIEVVIKGKTYKSYDFSYSYNSRTDILQLNKITERGTNGQLFNTVSFTWESQALEVKQDYILYQEKEDIEIELDIDNDGDLDYVSQSRSGIFVRLCENNSYGNSEKWGDFSAKNGEFGKDYDGNGFVDFYIPNLNGGEIVDYTVHLNTGKKILSESKNISVEEYEILNGEKKDEWLKIDLNNDGEFDLVKVDDKVLVKIANKGVYEEEKNWSDFKIKESTGISNLFVYGFLDIDDDGLPDLVLFRSAKKSGHVYKWHKNTGKSFSSNGEPVSDEDVLAKKNAQEGVEERKKLIYKVDFNGDGIEDNIILNDSENIKKIEVEFGIRNNKYSKAETWLSESTGRQIKLADLNRDGKLDIFWYNSSLNTFYCRYNNGKSFSKEILMGPVKGLPYDLANPYEVTSNYWFHSVKTRDVNDYYIKDIDIKDNYLDLVVIYNTDDWFYDAEYGKPEFLHKVIPTSTHITKVSFYTGNSINVKYKHKDEMTSSDSSITETKYVKRDKENQQLVFKIYEEDGMGNIFNDSSYKYGASFVYEESEKDKTALGFEYVQQEIKTSENQFIKIKTRYGTALTEKQRKFMVGRPVQIRTYDENYNKFTQVDYEYKFSHPRGLTDCMQILTEAENTTVTNGGNGKPKYYRKRWEYNDLGDVTLAADYGEVDVNCHDIGNDYTRTEYEYIRFKEKDAVANNVYSVLKSEKKYAQFDDRTRKLVGKKNYYYYMGLNNDRICQDDKLHKKRLLAKIEYYDGALPINEAIVCNREIRYEYDIYGKLNEMCDAKFNRTYYTYDKRFPSLITKVTDAEGGVIKYNYNDFGLLTSVTDQEGVVTSYEYDNFHRLIKCVQDSADPNKIRKVEYQYEIRRNGIPLTVLESVLTTNVDNEGYFKTRKFYNGIGYLMQEKCDAENAGEYRAVSYRYSVSGKLLAQTNPYKSTTSNYEKPEWNRLEKTVYTYDELDRLVQTTLPDGKTKSFTVYATPATTFSVDGEGNVKAMHYDCETTTGYSFVKKVDVTSGYDAIKAACSEAVLTQNLYKVQSKVYADKVILTESKGTDANTLEVILDSMGRKTSYTDPDKGTWTYTYDEVGNLSSQTDAHGNKLEFEYDSLNRMTKKITPDGNTDYLYNRDGTLDKVTYPSGSDSFTYNAQKQVTSQTRTVTGYGERKLCFDYTVSGLLSKMKYLDGEVVEYDYSKSGKLLSVYGVINGEKKVYCNSIAYNVFGKLESATFGNGIKYTKAYDSLARVSGLKYGNDILNYTYDRNSNIITKSDEKTDKFSVSESYTYDSRNRLITSTPLASDSTLVSHNYSYDDFNNIISFDGTAYTYAGHGNEKPHAVKEKGAFSFEYNANGDMICVKNGLTEVKKYFYDSENRMTGYKAGDKEFSYLYDSTGERLLKKNEKSSEVTLYWFPDYEEKYVDGKCTEKIKYYSGSEGVFAQTKTELKDEVWEEKLSYLYKDILGSTVKVFGDAASDGKIEIIESAFYEPFGKQSVDGKEETNRGFTGHFTEDDDQIYCHARWYDASLGRFIQADSVLDGFNRYCYCGNNPINYTDPTGEVIKSQVYSNLGKITVGIAEIVVCSGATPITAGTSAVGIMFGIGNVADGFIGLTCALADKEYEGTLHEVTEAVCEAQGLDEQTAHVVAETMDLAGDLVNIHAVSVETAVTFATKTNIFEKIFSYLKNSKEGADILSDLAKINGKEENQKKEEKNKGNNSGNSNKNNNNNNNNNNNGNVDNFQNTENTENPNVKKEEK